MYPGRVRQPPARAASEVWIFAAVNELIAYWAALAPLALLVVVVANHRSWEPSGDEIDVLHWAFLIGSGLAVPVCLAGAKFGRRYRSPADGRR